MLQLHVCFWGCSCLWLHYWHMVIQNQAQQSIEEGQVQINQSFQRWSQRTIHMWTSVRSVEVMQGRLCGREQTWVGRREMFWMLQTNSKTHLWTSQRRWWQEWQGDGVTETIKRWSNDLSVHGCLLWCFILCMFDVLAKFVVVKASKLTYSVFVTS